MWVFESFKNILRDSVALFINNFEDVGLAAFGQIGNYFPSF